MDEDTAPSPLAVDRSAVADELAELKSTVVKLAADRERLPQPLFWSLFHSRLESIKKQKQLKRLLNSALDGIGE